MTKDNQQKPTVGTKTRQTAANHLLEFEKVSFDDGASKPKATDEDLNTRYAKGEIRIVTEQARYPLANILSMLKEEIEGDTGEKELRYKLDPDNSRYLSPSALAEVMTTRRPSPWLFWSDQCSGLSA